MGAGPSPLWPLNSRHLYLCLVSCFGDRTCAAHSCGRSTCGGRWIPTSQPVAETPGGLTACSLAPGDASEAPICTGLGDLCWDEASIVRSGKLADDTNFAADLPSPTSFSCSQIFLGSSKHVIWSLRLCFLKEQSSSSPSHYLARLTKPVRCVLKQCSLLCSRRQLWAQTVGSCTRRVSDLHRSSMMGLSHWESQVPSPNPNPDSLNSTLPS